MKGNDEITGLFRSRLSGAEMTVRDGFLGGAEKRPVKSRNRCNQYFCSCCFRTEAETFRPYSTLLPGGCGCFCSISAWSCFRCILVFLSER